MMAEAKFYEEVMLQAVHWSVWLVRNWTTFVIYEESLEVWGLALGLRLLGGYQHFKTQNLHCIKHVYRLEYRVV